MLYKMEGGMRRWLGGKAKEAEPITAQWAACIFMHIHDCQSMVTGCEGKEKEMPFKSHFHFTFSICRKSLIMCNQSIMCKIIKLLHQKERSHSHRPSQWQVSKENVVEVGYEVQKSLNSSSEDSSHQYSPRLTNRLGQFES